jgi:Bacterial protein of unknown function (DUF937)/PRC-barrel domain
MTDNIVTAVSRFLTPELVSKLASASGLDPYMGQQATAAAVPAILSGLAELAGKPSGAQQLAKAVAQQPTGILGSIASSLTSGSAEMADKGGSVLASLLGGGALGTLASTIGKFLGVGDGPARSLMGLLTPVIMGVLGREQRAAGLDGNGLARMLTQQKDAITDAMPSGLASLLDTSGLYQGVASPSSPGPRVYDAPRTSIVQRTVDGTGSAGRVTWPLWVLPLLALGGLLWYLLPSSREVEVASRPAYLASAPSNWVSIGGTRNDYVNQDIYSRAGEKLGTIRDILIGPDSKMTAAVIKVDRYLGIGDKEIAVPFSTLQLQQSGNGQRIVIDATKDGLQSAPTFELRPTR